MKRIGFSILILSLISCSNNYKNYYNLYRLRPKDVETKTSISNKNRDLIYIYSFSNNILDKEVNGFESLTFNKITKEKIYIKTEEKNKKKYTFSNKSSIYFREFDFILQNYLDGNLEYLLSLEDSFSSCEVGSYFFIFDFEKNKFYKINAIVFDNTGKLIQ